MHSEYFSPCPAQSLRCLSSYHHSFGCILCVQCVHTYSTYQPQVFPGAALPDLLPLHTFPRNKSLSFSPFMHLGVQRTFIIAGLTSTTRRDPSPSGGVLLCGTARIAKCQYPRIDIPSEASQREHTAFSKIDAFIPPPLAYSLEGRRRSRVTSQARRTSSFSR